MSGSPSPSAIPFAKCEQLCKDLDPQPGVVSPSRSPTASVPGYPALSMEKHMEIEEFLVAEVVTTVLDKMSPFLWLLSTCSSSNISPLHEQLVKGRRIIVTEDPRLHLVWHYESVYIKPIPKYLLSHVFWEEYIVDKPSSPVKLRTRSTSVERASRGFLRSYAYLIKYQSDFNIAQQDMLGLVPATVTWEQFHHFTTRLRSIRDADVAPRYLYGELRLTRLNFWAQFVVGKWYYYYLPHQYSTFLSGYYVHLLFLFGVISVLLNALQVELNVEQVTTKPWTAAQEVSRYFSVICLFVTLMSVIVAMSRPLGMLLSEVYFACRTQITTGAAPL